MAARKTESVGKTGTAARQNPGPSVEQAPRCAGIADRRYRRSPIPAQNVARRASCHQIPGPSVPMLPDSRAGPAGLHRQPHLQFLSHPHAMICPSIEIGERVMAEVRSSWRAQRAGLAGARKDCGRSPIEAASARPWQSKRRHLIKGRPLWSRRNGIQLGTAYYFEAAGRSR